MAITQATVSVTTSATALNVQGGAQTLYIQNQGASVLTLGNASVAAGAGFPVAITNGNATVNVLPGEVLYGISSGTISVQVTRVGA